MLSMLHNWQDLIGSLFGSFIGVIGSISAVIWQSYKDKKNLLAQTRPYIVCYQKNDAIYLKNLADYPALLIETEITFDHILNDLLSDLKLKCWVIERLDKNSECILEINNSAYLDRLLSVTTLESSESKYKNSNNQRTYDPEIDESYDSVNFRIGQLKNKLKNSTDAISYINNNPLLSELLLLLSLYRPATSNIDNKQIDDLTIDNLFKREILSKLFIKHIKQIVLHLTSGQAEKLIFTFSEFECLSDRPIQPDEIKSFTKKEQLRYNELHRH